MLTSRTLRTVMLLLIAAAALHIFNHMFWWFYYPAHVMHKVVLNTDAIGDLSFKEELAVSSTDITSDMVDVLKLLNSTWTEGVAEKSSSTATSKPDDTSTDTVTDGPATSSSKKRQSLCPEIPPELGPVHNNFCDNAFEDIKKKVSPGGYFKFKSCKSRQRVAVIVPVRHAKKNVDMFLQHLHKFLMSQQLEYQVFVVGLNSTIDNFSRGRLVNVGFLEVRARYPRYRCFVIHEVNVVPMDTRNLYRCSWYPRQLAEAVEKNDKTLYKPKFGEAVALTIEQFSKTNGFPNFQRENTDEFQEMYERLISANYIIEKSPPIFGLYKGLYNAKNSLSRSKRVTVPLQKNQENIIDGLSSLTYLLSCFELRDYYTYINMTFAEDIQARTLLL